MIMKIDTSALSAHARLSFAAQTQPVLEAFLARATADGMSLSGCFAKARTDADVVLGFSYDDAGKRVSARFRTYRRKDGLGVHAKVSVLHDWNRFVKVFDSRGLAAKKIPDALAELRRAVAGAIALQQQRLGILQTLRGAGFQDPGFSPFPGVTVEKGGVYVEEDHMGWHIHLGHSAALEHLQRFCGTLAPK